MHGVEVAAEVAVALVADAIERRGFVPVRAERLHDDVLATVKCVGVGFPAIDAGIVNRCHTAIIARAAKDSP